MRETRRADLRVDGPEDDRWQFAVNLIEDSSKMIQMYDLLLYLDRDPRLAVRPVLVIEVDAYDWWKPSLEPSERDRFAEEQLARARARIAHVAATDERFAALMSRYGARYDLAVDYGYGAFTIADVDDDGRPTWSASARKNDG